MIDELKEILLNSDNEVDALNKLQEVAAKDNILEAIDDPELGISIESLGLLSRI